MGRDEEMERDEELCEYITEDRQPVVGLAAGLFLVLLVEEEWLVEHFEEIGPLVEHELMGRCKRPCGVTDRAKQTLDGCAQRGVVIDVENEA